MILNNKISFQRNFIAIQDKSLPPEYVLNYDLIFEEFLWLFESGYGHRR